MRSYFANAWIEIALVLYFMLDGYMHKHVHAKKTTTSLSFAEARGKF